MGGRLKKKKPEHCVIPVQFFEIAIQNFENMYVFEKQKQWTQKTKQWI